MAKITITFTDEHIRLIRCLRFKPLEIKHEKSELVKYTNYIRQKLDGLNEYKSNISVIRDIESKLESIDRASILSKSYAIEDNDKYYGIDTYDLFNADYWYDQMAHIIGCSDQVISGTEEDTDGPKYPEEVIEHLRELDDFLVTNIVSIEDILHQFCDRGGIKSGVTYVSYDYEGIWYAEEDWKKIGRR
jgi:hypothetical protein